MLIRPTSTELELTSPYECEKKYLMLALDWTLDEPQGVSYPPHHHLSTAPNRGLQNELKPSRCRSLSELSSIMYL